MGMWIQGVVGAGKKGSVMSGRKWCGRSGMGRQPRTVLLPAVFHGRRTSATVAVLGLSGSITRKSPLGLSVGGRGSVLSVSCSWVVCVVKVVMGGWEDGRCSLCWRVWAEGVSGGRFEGGCALREERGCCGFPGVSALLWRVLTAEKVEAVEEGVTVGGGVERGEGDGFVDVVELHGCVVVVQGDSSEFIVVLEASFEVKSGIMAMVTRRSIWCLVYTVFFKWATAFFVLSITYLFSALALPFRAIQAP
eukprot:1328166-Rhodomonas_salina.1